MDKKPQMMICPSERCTAWGTKETPHCRKHTWRQSCANPFLRKYKTCPSCIPYVEPSPANTADALMSVVKKSGKQAKALHIAPQPEPMPLDDVICSILADFADDLSEELREKIGMKISDYFKAHDQQVRKATLLEVVDYLKRFTYSALIREIQAHLRAMAGER